MGASVESEMQEFLTKPWTQSANKQVRKVRHIVPFIKGVFP